MSLWTPQHSRQMRTPRLTDSHSGPTWNKNNNKVYSLSNAYVKTKGDNHLHTL